MIDDKDKPKDKPWDRHGDNYDDTYDQCEGDGCEPEEDGESDSDEELRFDDPITLYGE